MKMKIKIVEFCDGSTWFAPMVKKHWYSFWKYGMIGGILTRNRPVYYNSEEEAINCLREFKSTFVEKIIEKNIDYKTL